MSKARSGFRLGGGNLNELETVFFLNDEFIHRCKDFFIWYFLLGSTYSS